MIPVSDWPGWFWPISVPACWALWFFRCSWSLPFAWMLSFRLCLSLKISCSCSFISSSTVSELEGEKHRPSPPSLWAIMDLHRSSWLRRVLLRRLLALSLSSRLPFSLCKSWRHLSHLVGPASVAGTGKRAEERVKWKIKEREEERKRWMRE